LAVNVSRETFVDNNGLHAAIMTDFKTIDSPTRQAVLRAVTTR
jgi:hypothetical protein